MLTAVAVVNNKADTIYLVARMGNKVDIVEYTKDDVITNIKKWGTLENISVSDKGVINSEHLQQLTMEEWKSGGMLTWSAG